LRQKAAQKQPSRRNFVCGLFIVTLGHLYRASSDNRLYRPSEDHLSKIVNGRSLQPLSGAAPMQIVLLLHGYGSSGADLISLAPQWRQLLPDALFLAPNAPQRCGLHAAGYQWWGLQAFTPQALAAGAASAAPAIDGFIDRKLDQYGLSESELALVGFSQGTMMALHVGPRRNRQVAAIVGYSGMLTGAAELRHLPITMPPVLLVHGSADPIVPVAGLHAAKHELELLGIKVSTHISNGLGHSVDLKGLELGGEFISRSLNQRR
jgi:phospholipase/carboxylesterase